MPNSQTFVQRLIAVGKELHDGRPAELRRRGRLVLTWPAAGEPLVIVVGRNKRWASIGGKDGRKVRCHESNATIAAKMLLASAGKGAAR